MIRQIFMPHPALSKNHILFQHNSFFVVNESKKFMLSLDFYAMYFCYLSPLFAETVSRIFHLFQVLDLEGLKSIKLYAEGCPPNIASNVYV